MATISLLHRGDCGVRADELRPAGGRPDQRPVRWNDPVLDERQLIGPGRRDAAAEPQRILYYLGLAQSRRPDREQQERAGTARCQPVCVRDGSPPARAGSDRRLGRLRKHGRHGLVGLPGASPDDPAITPTIAAAATPKIGPRARSRRAAAVDRPGIPGCIEPEQGGDHALCHAAEHPPAPPRRPSPIRSAGGMTGGAPAHRRQQKGVLKGAVVRMTPYVRHGTM